MPSLRRRSKLLLDSLAPWAIYASVVAAGDRVKFRHHFNCLRVRYPVYEAALRIRWLHPWLGVGPRWFFLPHLAGNIQPPDVIVETLVSTGLVGLVATRVVLLAGSGPGAGPGCQRHRHGSPAAAAAGGGGGAGGGVAVRHRLGVGRRGVAVIGGWAGARGSRYAP